MTCEAFITPRTDDMLYLRNKILSLSLDWKIYSALSILFLQTCNFDPFFVNSPIIDMFPVCLQSVLELCRSKPAFYIAA